MMVELSQQWSGLRILVELTVDMSQQLSCVIG